MTQPRRTPLISVDEALKWLLRDAEPLGTETVTLGAAHGRVLAAELKALRTQPPFPASAMDGYAVAHGDLVAGRPLTVMGTAAAGHPFEGALKSGECVRIFTGAPVPHGADTILIQEDAALAEDGTVTATDIPEKARYVRPAGLDFLEGDTLLAAGRVLDGGALCLAAAGNHAALTVWRKPVVAILATGDELRAPGSDLLPGQIIASNSYGVAAIAKEAGADVVDLGIAADSETAILDGLNRAHAAKADILVTLGGASVGDHDLIRPVFTGAGMALDFWKIAMRPGKPFMAGRLGPMRVTGLPGNPVSSMVCALLFVAPLVAKLAGREDDVLMLDAVLAAPIAKNGDREHYERATATRGPDGTIRVTAFADQDSSIISAYAKAHVLIVRPPHDPAREPGDTVRIRILRDI